jgi:hypothetical protein
MDMRAAFILTNALAAAQARDADIVLRLDVHELLTRLAARNPKMREAVDKASAHFEKK